MSIWIVSFALLIETLSIAYGLICLAQNQIPILPDALQVVIGCVLFGGLGGCTYCLRGVYLNACVRKSWDKSWLPWYFIRPIVSLVLGGMSYVFVKSGLLLFGATQQTDSSQLGLWAVAFLAGLNVDKFVAKIESIGHTAWGLEPSRQSKPVTEDKSTKTENETK